MTARGIPGGMGRRANNTGGISSRKLASGELRYHVRLHGKHLGACATRAEAEALLEALQKEAERTPPATGIDEVSEFNAEQFEALATMQRARRGT